MSTHLPITSAAEPQPGLRQRSRPTAPRAPSPKPLPDISLPIGRPSKSHSIGRDVLKNNAIEQTSNRLLQLGGQAHHDRWRRVKSGDRRYRRVTIPARQPSEQWHGPGIAAAEHLLTQSVASVCHFRAQASGRMYGNSSTSRIEAESVNSMTRRSMPMPSPAVGGRPYSRARM